MLHTAVRAAGGATAAVLGRAYIRFARYLMQPVVVEDVAVSRTPPVSSLSPTFGLRDSPPVHTQSSPESAQR